MEKPTFVDAQQMQLDHPKTFYAPLKTELDEIKINDHVKICVQKENEKGEPFWVKVQKIEGETITGFIDNNLVLTHLHGLKSDDVITFEKKNIYNIL
jgi:hypothetical protein